MPLEYHEPRESLSAEIQDQHRAIESLIEELEAVMWYHQRAAVCADEQLRAVLLHNRDEEIEHAMMNLEWVRRNWPEFDENMKTYLFTAAPIEQVEELAGEGEGGEDGEGGEGGGESAPGRGVSAGSLNIGSLRGRK
jgi:hypothetical protein